jgi:hypothetical protein
MPQIPTGNHLASRFGRLNLEKKFSVPLGGHESRFGRDKKNIVFARNMHFC